MSSAAHDGRDQGHVVLVGDSIFDNAAYVTGPDVITLLRQMLPAGWTATLAARDGAVLGDISRQLRSLPADTTHLVVSAGGNDALRLAGILQAPASSMAAAVARIADARDHFWGAYSRMLREVIATRRPVALCTIYDPRFADPTMRRITSAALGVLNDCITREVFAAGMPLIDLRLVASNDADFANAIEPSVVGGKKIAAAITEMLARHDFGPGRSAVFGPNGANPSAAAP
jgi:hypothetical protein